MDRIGIKVHILWCLAVLIKRNQAINMRQYDGNYFDNRGPSIGGTDMNDAFMPRIYTPSGSLDQGMVGMPNPLANAETPINGGYKEPGVRKITGKDLISQPIRVKIRRPGRPKSNFNGLDVQPIMETGLESDRLPSSMQPNSFNLDNGINYLPDGSQIMRPTNGYNNQLNIQDGFPQNDGPSNEPPTYRQCLSLISEKEKPNPEAGMSDWFRPAFSEYFFPRLSSLLGLARNNKDFDDLTSYRRQKNDLALNEERLPFEDSPNGNANNVDGS